MGSIPRFETVECKTIDGTIISGFLFPVPGPAPAIIMSHGVRSCICPSCFQHIFEISLDLAYSF